MYATVVMGASFRNLGQIEALCGCDRLTISPALLQQLAAEPGPLAPAAQLSAQCDDSRQVLDEAAFRWAHNEDAMATEKLAEGRSEEHTSELQSRPHLVCRLLLEKKNKMD